MAESACVRRSFSQPLETNHESKRLDPILCLRESVSFGRFVSESVDWDKWSSCNQKRYLEEAKKSSKPGSVAQKKAFFDAHYKRIAAQKAEATDTDEAIDAVPDDVRSDLTTIDECASFVDSETSKSDCFGTTSDESLGMVGVIARRLSSSKFSECSSNVDAKRLDCTDVEETKLVSQQICSVENYTSLDRHIDQLINEEKQDGFRSFREEMARDEIFEATASRDIFVSPEKTELANSSSKMSTFRGSSRAKLNAKSTITVRSRIESTVTIPSSHSSAANSAEKRRSTTKSLHMSITLDPHAGSTKKTKAAQTFGDSRYLPASFKMLRNSSNVHRTSYLTSMENVPKHSSVVAPLKSQRVQRVEESMTPNKNCGSSSMYRSKNPKESVRKIRSPTLSSPFNFRCEERVKKRKEFFEKLEEKNKAREMEKVQWQLKSKVKAGADPKKSSLSFKIRPIDQDSLSSNQSRRSSLTHPQSPKCGRKPISCTTPEMNSRQARRPPANTGGLNHVIEKSKQTPNSIASLSKKTKVENASPNIQA